MLIYVLLICECSLYSEDLNPRTFIERWYFSASTPYFSSRTRLWMKLRWGRQLIIITLVSKPKKNFSAFKRAKSHRNSYWSDFTQLDVTKTSGPPQNEAASLFWIKIKICLVHTSKLIENLCFDVECFMFESESEKWSQSCLTLHDPMDCSLPGSSIHGISQARVLEWVAIAF